MDVMFALQLYTNELDKKKSIKKQFRSTMINLLNS